MPPHLKSNRRVLIPVEALAAALDTNVTALFTFPGEWHDRPTCSGRRFGECRVCVRPVLIRPRDVDSNSRVPEEARQAVLPGIVRLRARLSGRPAASGLGRT